MFDGVHLGHQHVIRSALNDALTHGAPSTVLTFDPHPLRVVWPDRAPRLLQPLAQRLRRFAELGVGTTLVHPFTPDIARWSGEQFIRHLVTEARGIRSLNVGEGFQFGHGRSGNVSLLRELGRELGFSVHVAPPVALGGEVVSSSRIRQCLRDGRLEHVAELLGRPYALSGVVQPGDQRGRQLGFPTANLDVDGLELPPFGVYAARVRRITPPASADDWAAVLNMGVRPTVSGAGGEPSIRFEVHLLGFQGDLYGQELEVTLVQFLRPERRFESLEALRDQIARDCESAVVALG
jgi:riboflavin kinase/FMN adenylyltransferase